MEPGAFTIGKSCQAGSGQNPVVRQRWRALCQAICSASKSLAGGEVGDGSGAQQGDEAVLEGAEAALNLAFCLGVRGDAVGDARPSHSALISSSKGGERWKLRADIIRPVCGVAPKGERTSV